MKIRTRAILVIVSTNFIIILLSILAGTGYVREKIEEYIEADMMVVADIADRFISSELDLLKYGAGAAADALAGAEPEKWDGILALQMKEYPSFIGMSVLGRSAGVIASAGNRPASFSVLENESVQKAFAGQKAFTSTVRESDGVVFYLAVPISGREESVLVLTLDGMYFSNLASEYHIWETGHIFIDDSEGYVIANIRREWVENRQNFILQAETDSQYQAVADVVSKAAAGGHGIDYYSMGGISRICAYRPVSGSAEGWFLGIVAPLSESPVRNVDRGLFIIAGIGFLLNVAAAAVASNFIKRPFEQVAELKEAAESVSRAKSSFLAHMSHEIRTPLNAVIGLSELTLGEEDLSREAESNLEKIYGAGTTILSIANDILDMSKIESGKFELNLVRYDTPSMINDAVTLNAVRIGEMPIRFQVHVDENLPGSLYGDDLRVKQIFNNLLSNAFKYTNEGTVEWRITFRRDGDAIWLISSVKDTGIGIKPEDMGVLFSDFGQVDVKTNRAVGGTGLGLAIARRLAETMDGSISVESEYGKGSVFHVRIRQKIASETPIGGEVARNIMDMRYILSKRDTNTLLARADLSYASVLVVDDIITNLDVVKGMLRPYGLKVDCATGGRQAVEMIRAENPRYSAVFMDHMMPDMDGMEATRVIREEIGTDYARNIPVIALTANAIVGNEEMFLSRGFQAFISKPIDICKLDSVLRHWVRNRSKEKESGYEILLKEAVPAVKNCAALPEIAGLDREKALERFGANENVLADVLRSYAENTPPLFDDLGKYLESGNLLDYGIAVHGIKGSSYGIFAFEAGKAAEALEMAAKDGDVAGITAMHPGFERRTKALTEDIRRALALWDAAVLSVAEEPDPGTLSELREACGMFDMDRVDAAMGKLESFRYERGGALVAWLREQVNSMAFEAVSGGDWPDADEYPDFTAPGARILIVDDNGTNLKAARGLLKPLKMQVDTAENGNEALRMISGTQYHIIFMDHRMPGMDGVETTQTLKREYDAAIPVVALTSDEADDARETLLQAGMDDFLEKPIELKKAAEKIRKWIPAELLREPEKPAAADPETDLPDIEGIDATEGVRYSGTKELFLNLLGDFYKLIDLKAAKIEDAFADGLLRELAIEAHALKNTARMIGAKELSRGFRRLEQYGNEGNGEALKREIPGVLARYRELKRVLKPFGEPLEQHKQAVPKEELILLLGQIVAATDSFDLKTADGAVKRLENAVLPDECLEQMKTLRAYVADVAMEDAAKLAKTLIRIIEKGAEE